jgi:hypothetical protein
MLRSAPHVDQLDLPDGDRGCAAGATASTMRLDQTSELFDDNVTEALRAKAVRIADSLKLSLFYRPDRPWPRSVP